MQARRMVLVTGAAGGIGKALVHRFISRKYRVAGMDLDGNGLTALEQELRSPDFLPLMADISKKADVVGKLKAISDRWGQLPGILINNAAVGGPFHLTTEVSEDEWDWIMDTNLKSAFLLSQQLIPEMAARKFGRIINISSVQGFLGAPRSSTYVASKHGVIGYTRALAAEWGHAGITCNAVAPGYVDTKMGAQDEALSDHRKKIMERTPAQRMAEPDEIAAMIEYLVSPEAAFINGAVLPIDGGLSCHTGVS